MSRIQTFFVGFKKGINDFGTNISAIANSILLSLVYLIVVGITCIAAKSVKKKFLETRISKTEKTYWLDLNLKKKSFEEYYKRF